MLRSQSSAADFFDGDGDERRGGQSAPLAARERSSHPARCVPATHLIVSGAPVRCCCLLVDGIPVPKLTGRSATAGLRHLSRLAARPRPRPRERSVTGVTTAHWAPLSAAFVQLLACPSCCDPNITDLLTSDKFLPAPSRPALLSPPPPACPSPSWTPCCTSPRARAFPRDGLCWAAPDMRLPSCAFPLTGLQNCRDGGQFAPVPAEVQHLHRRHP